MFRESDESAPTKFSAPRELRENWVFEAACSNRLDMLDVEVDPPLPDREPLMLEVPPKDPVE